ncbi:hypothetical protein RN001_000334, partial [Aquatica leii]
MATSRFEINRLSQDELKYEILIKGFEDVGNVTEMRATLRGLFKAEKAGTSFTYPEYQIAFGVDKQAITSKIAKLTALIADLSPETVASYSKKFASKLRHILERCQRAKLTTPEKEVTQQLLVAGILRLDCKFSDRVKSLRRRSTVAIALRDLFDVSTEPVEEGDNSAEEGTVAETRKSLAKAIQLQKEGVSLKMSAHPFTFEEDSRSVEDKFKEIQNSLDSSSSPIGSKGKRNKNLRQCSF